MPGTNRPGFGIAGATLQLAGLIGYARGKIPPAAAGALGDERAARPAPECDLRAVDLADLPISRVRPDDDVYSYSYRLLLALAADHARSISRGA